MWQAAQRLTPAPVPHAPALISDGGGLPFVPDAAFAPFEPLDPSQAPAKALVAQIELGRKQARERAGGFYRRVPKPPRQTPAEALEGWRALAQQDGEILFGKGRPPHLLTVAVQRGSRDRWKVIGVSNSRPLRVYRDGVRASSWRLDPTFPVEPGQTELRVLLTEQTLASGLLAADRLLTPEIFVGDEAIVARLYVKPLEGYVGRTSRIETPVILELPEAVGERTVSDGSLYEPPLA